MQIKFVVLLLAMVCAAAPLSAEAAAAVPLTRHLDRVLVPVSLNGKPPLMLVVDTGASNTVILAEAAAELGLEEVGDVAANAIGGATRVAVHLVDTLEVGGLTVRDRLVGSHDGGEAFDGRAFGDGVDGLLGMDVLGTQPFTLDFEGPTLQLHDADAFEPPAGAGFEIRWDRRLPRVLLEVDGFASAWVQLDTGSEGMLTLYPAFVRQCVALLDSLPKSGVEIGGLGGQMPAIEVRVPSFAAMGRVWPGPPVTLVGAGASVGGDSDTGALGAKPLRARVLTIDPAGNRGWLSEAAAPFPASGVTMGRAEARDAAGESMLVRWIRTGNTGAALAGIAAGAGPIAEDDPFSPMLSAAGVGDVAVIEALAAAGSPVNGEDGRPKPLAGAARMGHEASVQALLAAGAAVDHADGDGWTALNFAAQRGAATVVSLLLTAGADPHGTASQTPLRLAIDAGHLDAARRLLAGGAHPDAGGRGSTPPIQVAVWGGKAALTELLLDAGADPGLVGPTNGATLLHGAASSGDAATVELLLKGGADRNAETKDGLTPLDEAIRAGSIDVLPLLR